MPSVSEKQRKLMASACKDKEFAEKVGIDQKYGNSETLGVYSKEKEDTKLLADQMS